MRTVERVDRLENLMAELAHAQMRTEMALLALSKDMRELKKEMSEFKDEMREFREESERDRKRMNKAWGDLANKLGTTVEFASWTLSPSIRKAVHAAGLYGLAMGDGTMEIVVRPG